MKMTSFLIAVLLILSYSAFGQYNFQEKTKLACTEIKNQAKTGTCWSFASASFLESELLRMGKGEHNLSEMYVVQNIYKDKARNYILRQGKAQFSQGSLAHDLLRVMAKDGIVPESEFSGLLEGSTLHDHSEMIKGLTGFLDGILEQKVLSDRWMNAFEAILTAYLGASPQKFQYQGNNYTPKSFAEFLGLDPNQYVHISSFTHHPFNKKFILEIPDNYSNGSYLNVPLDQLVAAADEALSKGYSVVWDGDVSEKSFSSQHGLAILPVEISEEVMWETPVKEKEVTQENRQKAFESYATTDDHLMHIIGKSVDSEGNAYYIVKNSWGERGPLKGYLHMSEAYFKMKTVSITVHQDAISGMIK